MAFQMFAVDPGAATGFAWFIDGPEDTKLLTKTVEPMECIEAVHDMAQPNCIIPTFIVCERFTVTSIRHTRQYDALETIGALRYVAYITGAQFILQSRSDRMRVDVAIAKDIAPDADEHGLDALRHLLVGLSKHGYATYVRSLIGRITEKLSVND